MYLIQAPLFKQAYTNNSKFKNTCLLYVLIIPLTTEKIIV